MDNLIKTIDELAVNSFFQLDKIKEELKQEKGAFDQQLFGDFEHTSIDNLVAEMLQKEMSEDHLNNRQEVIDYYNKRKEMLDKQFEEVAPPEIKVAIRELRAVEQTIEEMYENALIAQIKEYSKAVKTPSIDEIVKSALRDERKSSGILKKRIADKWRLAGKLVKETIEESKENKATAEIVLRNVNYSINKRVKLKREEKRKRK